MPSLELPWRLLQKEECLDCAREAASPSNLPTCLTSASTKGRSCPPAPALRRMLFAKTPKERSPAAPERRFSEKVARHRTSRNGAEDTRSCDCLHHGTRSYAHKIPPSTGAQSSEEFTVTANSVNYRKTSTSASLPATKAISYSRDSWSDGAREVPFWALVFAWEVATSVLAVPARPAGRLPQPDIFLPTANLQAQCDANEAILLRRADHKQVRPQCQQFQRPGEVGPGFAPP